MKTYIIGHQKPDTDAVVAAMALEAIYKTAESFGYTQPEAVITDPLNPETSYIFDKFQVSTPRLIKSERISASDQVVLVDHNEESQRLAGLNPDQIVEIVDHHKINLNLQVPIFATFKTWGSSTTIVYHLMQENKFVPDVKLASVMLAAVLSDTVGYKSPTTTTKDKEVGEQLAKIAGITDVPAFTLEIFKAKSNVSNLTSDQIVKNDYKVFEFAKKTFINQIEIVEQAAILNRKAELLTSMANAKISENADLVFCAVTDILTVNTKLLVLSESEATIAERAFGGKVVDNVLDIGAKLSRKKEIAPPIEQAQK